MLQEFVGRLAPHPLENPTSTSLTISFIGPFHRALSKTLARRLVGALTVYGRDQEASPPDQLDQVCAKRCTQRTDFLSCTTYVKAAFERTSFGPAGGQDARMFLVPAPTCRPVELVLSESPHAGGYNLMAFEEAGKEAQIRLRELSRRDGRAGELPWRSSRSCCTLLPILDHITQSSVTRLYWGTGLEGTAYCATVM
jgi:hypothetical protein